ncbi:MAG: selenium cofactor biosynthesis protein YqeC [Candidatus Promineifilaceae bacterium]|nr:selenium cofactor biosynthesis protein YqeC [Candidatus Promineifilaceae bacterium]
MNELAAALGLAATNELVALVGGGGKSTLLFALGRAMAAAGQRVILTSTTRLASEQVAWAPAHCVVGGVESDECLQRALDRHRWCVLIGELGEEKALGVAKDLPGRLLARPDVDLVLVEADGARRRPVKAPAEHEPAIPAGTTLLVVVAGVDALGQPIRTVAHRPERAAALLDKVPEETLTTVDLARLLAHPQGGLKGKPPEARAVVVLNRVSAAAREAAVAAGPMTADDPVAETARLLLANRRVDRVLATELEGSQPVREVWR